MKDYYTVREVAKLANRVPQTIYLHMKQGKIRGTKKGWYWRFSKEEVRRYLVDIGEVYSYENDQ